LDDAAVDYSKPAEGGHSAPKSSRATRALVLGLLSLPFGLLAPFAIWAALSSLRRIRKSDGALTGKTSAAFGLVAGILGITALIAGTLYWVLAS
jgi:hypothetical protein